MDKSSLGNRMKSYEDVCRSYLTPRTPILIRVDGCHFRTYTRGFKKPWDKFIQNSMLYAAQDLIQQIAGAEVAYFQSDEISVLLNTYKRFDTQQYLGGNVQKISTHAASIATAAFNAKMVEQYEAARMVVGLDIKRATFDGRCWTMPKEDVSNYFLWRHRDCVRNSISTLAQFHFSHKSLHKVNQKQMLQKLEGSGIKWDSYEPKYKYGTFVFKNGDIISDEYNNVKALVEDCLTQEEE